MEQVLQTAIYCNPPTVDCLREKLTYSTSHCSCLVMLKISETQLYY